MSTQLLFRSLWPEWVMLILVSPSRLSRLGLRVYIYVLVLDSGMTILFDYLHWAISSTESFRGVRILYACLLIYWKSVYFACNPSEGGYVRTDIS
jgi:hypothetical protein